MNRKSTRRRTSGVSDARGRRAEFIPLYEAITLTLLALLPSFVNLAAAYSFEEEKSLLARAAALVALPGVIVAWRRADRNVARHPVVIAFALFTAWLLVAALLGIAPLASLMGVHLRRHGVATSLALAVVFAAMCASAGSAEGRSRLLAATIAGSIWPCLYLFLQRAGYDPVEWVASTTGFLSGSTFGNHVFIAGYLSVVIPLTVAVALRTGRLVVATLAVAQLAALLASGGRGALVAVMTAGATAIGTIAATRMSRTRFAVAVVAAVLIVGVPALTPSLRPSIVETRFDPGVGSARVRVLVWSGVGRLLRESGSRLWIGYGPESLHRVFPPYYKAEIGRLEGVDAMPDRAHNETLDALVSTGIIGAVSEITLFTLVIVSTLRVTDLTMRAALAAAAVAHVVDIHFGIATTPARLVFVSVAALSVNWSREPSRERKGTPWVPLIIAAVVGAVSPLISTIPERVGPRPTGGTPDDLLRYVWDLSSATLLLYVAAFAAAILVCRWGRERPTLAPSTWIYRMAIAGAVVAAAVPLAVTPSRADTFARVAIDFEGQQAWAASAITYAEAVRLQPAETDYLDGLARTRVREALTLDGAERDKRFQSAREALERARAIEPQDPNLARHLGAIVRVRALTLDEGPRTEALNEAAHAYEEATRLAPELTSLWIEWAFVETDRGNLNDAREKLAHALALDPTRAGADVEALKTQLQR